MEKIRIKWVEAHSNVTAKDTADAAVIEAIESGVHIDLNMELSTAIKLIEQTIWEDWDREYQRLSEDKGIFLFNIFPQLTNKKWFKDFDGNAKATKLVNRLITNHGYNNQFLHRTKKKTSKHILGTN